MPVVTVDSNPKFQEAFLSLQDILTTFAEKPTEEITTVLVSSFGENFDVSALLSLASQLQTGQFTSMPIVESVPASDLNGATAAYSASLNTTYISEEYLATSSTEELTTTLLQQLGYGIDELINTVDAPGEEGTIWATLVQGESLSAKELEQLKAEDNNKTLTINNQTIEVEVSRLEDTSLEPDDSSGGGIDNEGSDNPFQGGKGKDRFKGTDADDDMSGGGGKDRLVGGKGDDKMDGGGGKDFLKGGDGDDDISGGSGSDKLNGGNDDDLLNGGSGKDKMKGGKGSDQFIYEKMGDRGDIISDFDPSDDVLSFSELFADLGITESRFGQLLDDVIILGSTRKGTQVSIDVDGLDGNSKAKKLVFLNKVDGSDLKGKNFEI